MKPIISPNIRLRHPEDFHVGEHSIVDDFCYFSTRVKVGYCSHIASGCSVAGGIEHEFTLGDFSSLSSGVKVWCASDNFVEDVVTIVPAGLPPIKTSVIEGDVEFGDFTAAGANSVIMPRNQVPLGTVIGALSFVPPDFPFEEWAVYAGNPLRFIKRRNRDQVTDQVARLREELSFGVRIPEGS